MAAFGDNDFEQGPRRCIWFEIVSMRVGDKESCNIKIGIICNKRNSKGRYCKMKRIIERRVENSNKESIVR